MGLPELASDQEKGGESTIVQQTSTSKTESQSSSEESGNSDEGDDNGDGRRRSDSDLIVALKGASFSWSDPQSAPSTRPASPTAGEPALRDITFQLAPGELCMVVGQVGSGKSSLVSAILGELYQVSIRIIWHRY